MRSWRVVALLSSIAALGACGEDGSIEPRSRATLGVGTVWGPLAVRNGPPNGAEALLSGTLEITDDCVFLRNGDRRALIVWPSETTTWNAGSRTIRYTADGEATWGNGDDITVGGGGWSRSESDDDYWTRPIEWAAEPSDACRVDEVVSFGYLPAQR